MKTRRSRIQVFLTQVLLFNLVLNSLIVLTATMSPVEAQNGKPIIISFGQPNIWSLEQAHYLLARLRSQSLTLQGRELVQSELDPNEVNGTRLDILKTMLGVGVGFSQAAGFQNQQATKEATFSQERRHELLALRDQRQSELHSIDAQLATLRVDREKMNGDSSATDPAKQLKTVEIEQTVQLQSKVSSEITSLTSEINGLPATATALATPNPPSAVASPLANSVTDELLKTTGFQNELNSLPKLNASTKLDNYLNLQYEIIAKQLTLLRDEVGPGQRLVFLELPHSFYTVPDKANRKMAQVWWKVTSYYEHNATREDKDAPPCRDEEKENVRKPTPRALLDRFKCNPYGSDPPQSESSIFAEINEDRANVAKAKASGNFAIAESARQWLEKDASQAVRAVDLIPRQSALNVNDIQDRQKNFNVMGLFTWLSGLGASVSYQREQRLYHQFLQQEVYASAFGKGQSDFGWTFGPRPGSERIAPGLQNTYAVLVVPENAEAITLNATGCYFPRSDYAPNKFEDTNENGGPTSMAAVSNKLQCTAHDNKFDLVIPSTTNNNFWITGINYRPVKPGERATVYLHGDYFSPQIGVLVNGIALRHSVGLAQSELALPRRDTTFEPSPVGDFEFVNSKLLVLSFSIPDFKGIPTIALVTPGRARVINNLRLVINDSYKCSAVKLPNCPQAVNSAGFPVTDDEGKPVPVTYKKASEDGNVSEKDSIWVRLDNQVALFSAASPSPVLTVDALKVFEPMALAPTFRALITGSKFAAGDEIRVNGLAISAACFDHRTGQATNCSTPGAQPACLAAGKRVKCPRLLAPGLIEVEFPATNDSVLEVTVIHNEKNPNDSVYSTKSFPNPFSLRVERLSILGYQGKGKPRVLRIQLEGVGFSLRINADAMPDAEVISQVSSPTTMILDLKLLTTNKFITITLRDQQTGISIPVVVTRPEEEAQTEKSKPAEDTKPSGRRPAGRVR
ncbi:MAG: hypothetical protein QOG23_4069 [Blastocatellia bacterium]|jgi:hypothetical protein|nr:hypothetical protein [Blastocatellia bacterium]